MGLHVAHLQHTSHQSTVKPKELSRLWNRQSNKHKSHKEMWLNRFNLSDFGWLKISRKTVMQNITQDGDAVAEVLLGTCYIDIDDNHVGMTWNRTCVVHMWTRPRPCSQHPWMNLSCWWRWSHGLRDMAWETVLWISESVLCYQT